MQYLIIDGNNLAIRSAFGNKELKNKDGVPTGVHFGVFQSLINLRGKYPHHQFLILWDSKSKRRQLEASVAVTAGLIKSGYKENRPRGEEAPQELRDFYAQAPYLQKGIGQTGIPQIRIDGFEADDVGASYAKKLQGDNEIVFVTGDNDYFQLLSPNVSVYDGMKDKTTTLASFQEEYKITPEQFVHCGALSGDTSDNIFGVPSVGEVTALKLIQEHGSWQKVLEALKAQLAEYRIKFPDLSGNPAEFERLKALATDSGKPKYPEILLSMPFTGVVQAIEDKKLKVKIPKTTLMTVMFEERVKMAYSLKLMDSDIPALPEIKQGTLNKERLLEYFDYYDIESLKESLYMLE